MFLLIITIIRAPLGGENTPRKLASATPCLFPSFSSWGGGGERIVCEFRLCKIYR